MKFQLYTISHAPMSWHDKIPPVFSGVKLPGSSPQTTSGSFGTISIQEFATDQYSIRYHVMDIIERFAMKIKNLDAGIHFHLALNGQVQIENDKSNVHLSKNHFIALNSPSETTIVLTEGMRYHGFDTFFTREIIDEVLNALPSFQQNLLAKFGPSPPIMSNPLWANADTLEYIQSILNCNYEKDLRRYFFESRVKDLLFQYLLQLSSPDKKERALTQQEIDAAVEAEKIINSDISKHIPIPDLARKVQLNEFALKAVFKKIFGRGLYEHLLYQRMRKAKELLEAGLSVKEVAAQTGYRPSDFTTAFFNHYGFPPSSVKRKD